MKIKLLILDIDGILTDGKKYYDLAGMPFAKTYCDKDFTAIKRFKSLGIPVVFLTGDAKVNQQMAHNRNIPVYLSRGVDKETFVTTFETEYGCTRQEMCYVGDDLFDINIMKQVGFKFCPKNSPNIVKEHATVLDVLSGDDVVCFLFDYCEQTGLVDCVDFENTMQKIQELDAKETF